MTRDGRKTVPWQNRCMTWCAREISYRHFGCRRREECRTYVELAFRDLRSLVDALSKGIAGPDGLDPFNEAVVESRLHKDMGTSAAGLAVVPAENKRLISMERRYGRRLTRHHELPNQRPVRDLRR